MGYSIDKTSTLNLRLLLYRLLFYNLYKIDLGVDFKKLWIACNSNFELTDPHQFILKLYTTIHVDSYFIQDYERMIYKHRLTTEEALNSLADWERFLYRITNLL